MPASFSSISFEAETAKRFKELSDKRGETHSQTLRYLLDKLYEDNKTPYWSKPDNWNDIASRSDFNSRRSRKADI